MGYSWTYGAAGTGLSFEVTYTNDGDVSLSMLEGSMDLNALWFAPAGAAGSDITLEGKDNSLNMNGIPIAWNSYAKISDTGLKDGGLIAAGDTVSLTGDFAGIDPAGLTLGIRATSVNGDDGIKLVSTASFFDDIPPTLAGAAFAYAENQAAGFLVGTVTATDVDSSIASYQFMNETDTSDDGLFVINNLGEISFAAGTETSAANDFETLENEFTYEIQATDSEGNVSEAAEVSITVEDDPSDNGSLQTISGSQTIAVNYGGSPGTGGQTHNFDIGGLTASSTATNGSLFITLKGDYSEPQSLASSSPLPKEFATVTFETPGDGDLILDYDGVYSNTTNGGLTLDSFNAINDGVFDDSTLIYQFSINDTLLGQWIANGTLTATIEDFSEVNFDAGTADFVSMGIEYEAII